MRTIPTDTLLAITLRAIGDGVISCDQEGRVVLMNTVAASLTGWPEQEAVGQPLSKVFVILNEFTREPVEDPLAKVLRLGGTVGMAEHTLLVRRDGTEVSIDDSAAPVTDESGFRGAVLVFRDITERRRAEWNLELISESGRILGEERDEAAILSSISRAVSRHFADFCIFDMKAEGQNETLERVTGVHRNASFQPLVDHLGDFRPRENPSAHPARHVLSTSQSCLLTEVSDELLEHSASSQEHLDFFHEVLRPKSLLAVPIVAREELLGALTFHRHLISRPFTEADVPVAEELGRRIGLALHYARIREELRMQRARVDAIVQAVPVGIVVAETSGKIVVINDEVEHIFRHPPRFSQDIEAHAEYIAFHPNGQRVRGHEFPMVRSMQQDRIFRDERYQFLRGDNTRVWVSLSSAPVKDDQGKMLGSVVAISDIDQQVHSQQAMEDAKKLAERSSERSRLLTERASVGVAIGELEGCVKYANHVLLRWIGYTEEEVNEGKLRWRGGDDAEGRRADARAVEQLEIKGYADPYERMFMTHGGNLIPMLVGATMIPGERDDTPDDVAIFFTDLSLQKVAEAALLQTEKLTAVGRLASSISHEINNPLEAVTNLLFLARLDPGLTQAGKDFLDTADRELARVTQITSQTLRFHRQTTAATLIRPENLLEEVLGIYRSRLNNSDIQIRRDFGAGVQVRCFEGDIRQVLSNLIGNAFDAMRNGGTLHLRTRYRNWWVNGERGVSITLADTGPGIPGSIRSRIFDAFYSTKGIHGTGLGLWISKRIVHKHQGHLNVRSCEGKVHGTIFTLWLPLNLASSAHEAWHDQA